MYGTTTIRISSVAIIYNLPLFVPPPQLQHIISLDLDLLVEKEPSRLISGDAGSRLVTSVGLPSAANPPFPFLPSLRFLHLAVERHYDLDKLHPTYNAKAIIETIPSVEMRRRRLRQMIESQLLVRIDAWISQMAPARAECDVSVPASMFESISREYKLAGPRSKRGVTCEQALWRQMAPVDDRHHDGKGHHDERCTGYWIQGGLYDNNFFYCSECSSFSVIHS